MTADMLRNKKSKLASDIRKYKAMLRLFERFLEVHNKVERKRGRHDHSNITRNSMDDRK